MVAEAEKITETGEDLLQVITHRNCTQDVLDALLRVSAESAVRVSVIASAGEVYCPRSGFPITQVPGNFWVEIVANTKGELNRFQGEVESSLYQGPVELSFVTSRLVSGFRYPR